MFPAVVKYYPVPQASDAAVCAARIQADRQIRAAGAAPRPGALLRHVSTPELQAQATEIIRSLIDRIVVAKRDDGLEIELIGDLAAMVEVAQGQTADNKKAALVRAALSATDRRSVKVVAGAHNHLYRTRMVLPRTKPRS